MNLGMLLKLVLILNLYSKASLKLIRKNYDYIDRRRIKHRTGGNGSWSERNKCFYFGFKLKILN